MSTNERQRQKKLAKKNSKRKKVVTTQKLITKTSRGLALESMSDVLLEFIEPLMNEKMSNENLEKTIELGIIAWNLTLVSAEEKQKILEDVSKETDLWWFQKSRIETVINFLIDRKNNHFAHINRMIADYELIILSEDRFHLRVYSTLD